MYGPARLVMATVLTISAANQAYAQLDARSTAEPLTTAQNEAWYLNGEPVVFEGNLYLPAGPRTYFNRYEMVRSGFFRGVPLYTRTTIEPYSLVFVPIGGGLMQPYRAAPGRGRGWNGRQFHAVVPGGDPLGTGRRDHDDVPRVAAGSRPAGPRSTAGGPAGRRSGAAACSGRRRHLRQHAPGQPHIAAQGRAPDRTERRLHRVRPDPIFQLRQARADGRGGIHPGRRAPRPSCLHP